MRYTFYHAGVLIGESKLEDARSKRQRAGVFHPTAYGLDIFPRLTGILSAGHALETHLRENGLSLDHMERAEVEHLFDTNPAGQKIIDIGRMLSEVEIQAPNGPEGIRADRVHRSARVEAHGEAVEPPGGRGRGM